MQTLTKTYTGAKLLIETLKDLGCDTIFGYPGGIVLQVYDELSKQNDIKHFLVRHEQAAVHAAEGYARVSGKCGVVLVTSGPGATNIVTGIANAYLDGFPLVVITGQVSAELLHQDAFQEVDIIDITKSCTKKNFQIKNIENLQDTLTNAFKTALEDKPGPVVVDITKNVFSELSEFKPVNIESQSVDYYNDLNSAISAINNAKRPVIITGGGAIDAADEIREFADKMQINVVSTMMGLGVYPADGINYRGMIGIFGSANNVVAESDLVIAVGTRFNDRVKPCLGKFEQKLIRIDISKKELFGHVDASIKLLGDAKNIIKELLSRCTPNNYEIISANIKNPQIRSDRMHSCELTEAIFKCIKKYNPVITTEVGQHQVWAARYLKFNEPRKFLTSGGLGTMGFGFPSAIGASVALNNRAVVRIAGDGSFQMNLQELATCMDYKLPVKVFIFNNGYLGMVRQFQEKMCEQRYFATQISNPDFVKLAQSYGAKGIRVDSITNVPAAIDEAFAYDGPVIVDFIIEPMEVL